MRITEKNKKILIFSYVTVTSLMLIASGICLIGAAYGINSLGDSPFTYKSISEAFSKIAPAIYTTLALVLIGAVLSPVVKEEKKKIKGSRSLSVQIKREENGRVCEPNTEAARIIKKERLIREIILSVNLVLFVFGAVVSLVYALDGANYTDELNSSVLHMFVLALVAISPSAILFAVAAYLFDSSRRRELEIWKTLPKKEKEVGACQAKKGIKIIFDVKFWERAEVVLSVRLILLSLSVAFIALGIYNGGMNDVLEKAIKICTECIGLG